MTKDEFHEILHKPESECDGCDLHLRSCWERNAWKSIFQITGIDFSSFGGEQRSAIIMKNPQITGMKFINQIHD